MKGVFLECRARFAGTQPHRGNTPIYFAHVHGRHGTSNNSCTAISDPHAVDYYLRHYSPGMVVAH